MLRSKIRKAGVMSISICYIFASFEFINVFIHVTLIFLQRSICSVSKILSMGPSCMSTLTLQKSNNFVISTMQEFNLLHFFINTVYATQISRCFIMQFTCVILCWRSNRWRMCILVPVYPTFTTKLRGKVFA